MSVKTSLESGILLCHLQWIKDNQFSNYVEELTGSSILAKLFCVHTPFLMDAEANKKAIAMEKKICNATISTLKKGVKRKATEEDENPIRRKDFEFIVRNLKLLQETKDFENIFNHKVTPDDYRKNNRCLRIAREKFFTCLTTPVGPVTGMNSSPNQETVTIDNSSYVIPPGCRYICDDVHNMEEHLPNDTFDIIVLDPPWENKHIRRKRNSRGLSHSYWTMSLSEIASLPLQSLLHEESFVFIWVTNNNRIREALSSLLSAWGLHEIGTWHWLKLTKAGEPVVALDGSNNGKLPYEKLLVAKKADGRGTSPFPKELLIASVPSGIHSHKPPLKDIVEKYLPNSRPRCLELFARSLTPSWTCYGLEVLKLNSTALLQELCEVKE